MKLQYIDDDPESYQNIFGNAKTDVSSNDEAWLIESLKKLSSYEDLEDVLDMDAVLRYFVVHNFVVNGDSYTGSMIHNYYLYEQDGKLSMLPWDYNLAFGGFHGNNSTTCFPTARCRREFSPARHTPRGTTNTTPSFCRRQISTH